MDNKLDYSDGLVSYSHDEGGGAWRAAYRAIEKVSEAVNRQLETRFKLSFGDFLVLDALAVAPPEGLRMTQLAEATLVSKSRLSHCVDRMEATGLVRRVRPEHDRRGFYAVLTEEGRGLHQSACPTVRQAIGKYVGGPLDSHELVAMRDIATKIVDAVDSDAGGRTGEVGSAVRHLQVLPTP